MIMNISWLLESISERSEHTESIIDYQCLHSRFPIHRKLFPNKLPIYLLKTYLIWIPAIHKFNFGSLPYIVIDIICDRELKPVGIRIPVSYDHVHEKLIIITQQFVENIVTIIIYISITLKSEDTELLTISIPIATFMWLSKAFCFRILCLPVEGGIECFCLTLW